jgi:hypothetical protein
MFINHIKNKQVGKKFIHPIIPLTDSEKEDEKQHDKYKCPRNFYIRVIPSKDSSNTRDILCIYIKEIYDYIKLSLSNEKQVIDKNLKNIILWKHDKDEYAPFSDIIFQAHYKGADYNLYTTEEIKLNIKKFSKKIKNELKEIYPWFKEIQIKFDVTQPLFRHIPMQSIFTSNEL